MKKFACLLVALILCVSCVAMASAASSKTVSNLTQTTTPVTTQGFVFKLVVEDDPALLEIAQKEIEKIAASESVEAYFGELGADLKAKVEAETLNVNELHPVVASGYTDDLGEVTVQLQFATPYAVGDKVAVAIGLVTVAEDGTQTVAWTAYDAVVIAESVIEVTLDPATVMAIQEGSALLAVVSK